MRARDAPMMVDLMRFITATAPALCPGAVPPGSDAAEAEPGRPTRAATQTNAPGATTRGKTAARTLAAEVRQFVCGRCVLGPRVWCYRDELWAAYSAWAGTGRLCRRRDDLEAPLLAAKVAIIGISGEIIAGVGLREHWPREAPEADGRRGR